MPLHAYLYSGDSNEETPFKLYVEGPDGLLIDGLITPITADVEPEELEKFQENLAQALHQPIDWY